MRRLVLVASVMTGVASIVLIATSVGAVPPPDPTGSVPAGQPVEPSTPVAYLTGLLLVIGGAAVLSLPVVASVLLGIAAVVGMAVGVMGDSQDQLAFGILALILMGITIFTILREGKAPAATEPSP